MKKRIYCMLLLLVLIFSAGCNKEKTNHPVPTPTEEAAPTNTPTPTSTPTPTPTPVPENLAKIQLEKLPEQFDTLMSYNQETTADLSKGIGYDITMDISLGDQIISLLGLEGLEKFGLSGTFDMKDTIAANLSLNLNNSEVINAHAFADSSKLYFNLPKYSANYAVSTWEELLESADMDASAFSGITTEALTASADLPNKLRSHLVSLVNCFDEVDGITKDATIGTGDYTLTGEKHTVKASKTELIAVFSALEETLSTYTGTDMSTLTDDFLPEESNALVLDYYVDANGNYAWAFYPDSIAAEPPVFINTDKGFCLYREEDGVASVLMSSVKSSETSGTVTMFDGETDGNALFVADYTAEKDTFNMVAKLYQEDSQEPIELTLKSSTANEILSYDLTVVVEGMSIVMKQTTAKNDVTMSLTLASYGVKYATIDYIIKLRDYVEIPTPANTTTIDTWVNSIDQTALTSDLMTLMQEYPFLMTLMGLSGEDFDPDNRENEWVDDTPGDDAFEMPAGYTDDFMNMTGYSVDEDGYVDFEPLPDEVFAAGKPSTGLDTLKVSDDQVQALFDIAKKAIPNCQSDSSAYYWVWGSVEYDDVRSYYTNEFEFDDPDNWDNSITFTFDAISGEFTSVDIYHASKEEALRIANEVFQVLGGTYTITDTMVEDYTYDDENGFSFSGYDAAQYGSNYYNVGISIYSSDWDW